MKETDNNFDEEVVYELSFPMRETKTHVEMGKIKFKTLTDLWNDTWDKNGDKIFST